jgi:hypothetical protein
LATVGRIRHRRAICYAFCGKLLLHKLARESDQIFSALAAHNFVASPVD